MFSKHRFLLAGLLVALTVGRNAHSAVVENAEPSGPYAVGLKIVDQYDYTRLYRPQIDNLGQPVTGERARPIQTLIWYPALKSSGRVMTTGDYIHLMASSARYETTAAAMAEEAAAQKDAGSSLNRKLSSVRDAPAAAGRYPVVIYAPAMEDDAWDNAPLCEYLASRGYIVIAGPSTGPHGISMDPPLAAANTGAADVLFLLGYAQTLPHADPEEIAVMGYSYGGIVTFFAAARDSRIKAEIAMDGTMRMAPDLVKSAGDIHAEQMAIPLLFFGGVHRPDPAGDIRGELGTDNILYAWRHGDVYTAWMRQMKHPNFASFDHRRDPSIPVSAREAAILDGTDWVAHYAGIFLDAYLRRDDAALAALKRAAGENGAPPSIAAVHFRPGEGAPPSFDGFRKEIARRGFAHAGEIYAAMHQELPDFHWEESKYLNGWVYTLIGSRPADAIGLLKAYQLAAPNSSEVYYLYAQAYEKLGQKALAIANYKKTLQIDGSFSQAAEKLKALEG